MNIEAKKRSACIRPKQYRASYNCVTPTKTVFATDKGYLHRVISSTISDCRCYDKFQKKLYEQYGIEVHESRKQISYLLPDHRKLFRGKSLGTDFERISIERSIEETLAKHETELQFQSTFPRGERRR